MLRRCALAAGQVVGALLLLFGVLVAAVAPESDGGSSCRNTPVVGLWKGSRACRTASVEALVGATIMVLLGLGIMVVVVRALRPGARRRRRPVRPELTAGRFPPPPPIVPGGPGGGWFEDPYHCGQLRYADGHGWTPRSEPTVPADGTGRS